jgi:uncharacterized protein
VSISRRNFLALAGAGATGFVLATNIKNFSVNTANGKTSATKGFGALIKDPKGILDLPEGFQYRVISRTGDMMTDGTRVPTRHDGMAAFAGANNTTILVRNHEINPDGEAVVSATEAQKYDKLSQGGTTTIVLDNNRQAIEQYVSLAGTNRNCSGGTTTWGSWISCEEDVAIPIANKANNDKTSNNKKGDRKKNKSDAKAVSRKHGYNFEVFAGKPLTASVPLIAMGRFRHEAIATDPNTGIIYQTEDQQDSCIYRFIPKVKNELASGGILEALVIKGMLKAETALNFPQNEPKSVEWVKMEDVDPEGDTLRQEAQSKGAAIFRRGEGMCYADGYIYWTCTNGGMAEKGQIFRYDTAKETVELFVESPGASVLDFPDNLIMSPFGDLIVCEDGVGEQFLTGIDPKGKCYHFARNALNEKEFAGACFSPDGQTMFVNIYEPGLTLAIWGNWQA